MEIATSNMEKGKDDMKPIAKIVGDDRNTEFGKSNIKKGKIVMNHIKLEDDINVANNVSKNIKKKGRKEKRLQRMHVLHVTNRFEVMYWVSKRGVSKRVDKQFLIMMFQLKFINKVKWVTLFLSGRSSYSMQKARQKTYW